MIFENKNELTERIESTSGIRVRGEVAVIDDTSEYLDICRGMVLRLEGNDYLVTGNAREGRFGLDEEPKFWVKYAMDLASGERKIIKLVFYEEFQFRRGSFIIRNIRKPEKESHILDLVRGHPNFMQGKTVRDSKNNNVRIIDFIRGPTLFAHISNIQESHEKYFFQRFPQILSSVIESIEAMDFLNRSGEHHGDIRNDHIIIDADSGIYRWIDFDYSVNYPDYDLWSIGNILMYVVGKGIHAVRDVESDPTQYPLNPSAITPDDTSMFFRYRVANLKKLFPYLPRKLNNVLLRFSFGGSTYDDDFQSQIIELRDILSCFPSPDGA